MPPCMRLDLRRACDSESRLSRSGAVHFTRFPSPVPGASGDGPKASGGGPETELGGHKTEGGGHEVTKRQSQLEEIVQALIHAVDGDRDVCALREKAIEDVAHLHVLLGVVVGLEIAVVPPQRQNRQSVDIAQKPEARRSTGRTRVPPGGTSDLP